MPDIVLDYHRLKTPIDHPNASVTTPKLATLDYITLGGLTVDPALAPGRVWFRSDLARISFSPNGAMPILLSHYPIVSVSVLTSDVTVAANAWVTLLSASITLDVKRLVFVIGMCAGYRSGAGKSYIRLRRDTTVIARGMSYESESTSYAPDWSTLVIAHAEELEAGSYTYYLDVYSEGYSHYFRAATYPDYEGARLIVLAF
jgi:hypothetical protein